jgi:Diacylglycerol kinase catalytic domain
LKRTTMHLVHNSKSGAFVRGLSLDDLRGSIGSAGWDISGETDLAAETPDALDRLASTSADVIAIAGRDGTLISVLGALVEQGIDLPALILPCGTANLLARYVHSTIELGDVLEKARQAPTDKLPLGEANGHLFAVAAAVGISPGLAKARERLREPDSANRAGRFWSYIRAGLRSFFRGRFYVDLMQDEAPRPTTALYVACPDGLGAEKTFAVHGGRMRNIADLAAGVIKTALPLPDNQANWTAQTLRLIVLTKHTQPLILDGEPIRMEGPITIDFCRDSVTVLTV